VTVNSLQLTVDGRQVEVPADGSSLLDVLRDRLGLHSPKDGCSPQGQCGCCTVLVDGAPRVACVTPARRVAGRSITTLDGFDPAERQAWADAFCATGASQCGFCTPGIIVRLAGLSRRADRRADRSDMVGVATQPHDVQRSNGDPSPDVPKDRRGGADGSTPDRAAVARALQAHLCRCTGWQTILEAAEAVDQPVAIGGATRNLDDAARRAGIEGRAPQLVGPDVALGRGGFADDGAPADALVAVTDGVGGWAVGETLAEARAVAGKVQGRRTTIDVGHPLEVPEGDWAVTLRTTWVEPGYLETDAAWCAPGGEPATPLGNGGAFGGKVSSPVTAAARELADRHGRPVRVLLSREDTVRFGPKRPPIAAGIRADGTGVILVVRTPGIAKVIATAAPGLKVEEVDVAGPPTSAELRAAGWAEAAVLLAGARGAVGPVTSPDGAVAEAEIDADGKVRVRVACGDPLDEVVLRSYCIGAAHMALGWVRSEGLAVDEEGEVHDLTVRSFGILRAIDTPPIEVEIDATADGPPVNGSDAVFAAVAAAAWIGQGCPQDWPTARGARR
jgi:aerobic-type carbon monoxide dehydrogenase small subunit (CoxS/CutS family)